MRPLPLLLGFILLAGAAPPIEWRVAPEYDVRLASYDIEPKVIHLRAGHPVRLRFVNNSNRGLAFAAPSFFRSSHVRRRDTALLAGGSLDVPPMQTRTIALVPKAGRYKARSSNFLHRLLGMRGMIIVE